MINELTWNIFRNHFILKYEIPRFDGDLGRLNVYIPVSEELAKGQSRDADGALRESALKELVFGRTLYGDDATAWCGSRLGFRLCRGLLLPESLSKHELNG